MKNDPFQSFRNKIKRPQRNEYLPAIEENNENEENEVRHYPTTQSKKVTILDYVFTPQEDITIYELSKIMSYMILSVSVDTFTQMPPAFHRHFTKFEATDEE